LFANLNFKAAAQEVDFGKFGREKDKRLAYFVKQFIDYSQDGSIIGD
jgi:hypothetical protein